MTSRDALQARARQGPSPVRFDAVSRRSVRECFDPDSEARRGIGRRAPGCIVRGEAGLFRQRPAPGGDVRLDASDAQYVLTGKAPFRARLRGRPERFAELAAAKPRAIGRPCRRTGYREIRPNLPPDNGSEGCTTPMGAPGRDFAQNRRSTAGFADFLPEFSAHSRVAVSTADPISDAAPDLPRCQREFLSLCWTP